MLVIRFQRTGRKNLASYRLVVAEKARAVKGKYLDIVGHYLPQQQPKVFQFNKEKIETWVKKGAVPSDTVARVLKKNGVNNMDKFIKRYAKRKSKNEAPEEPAAAAAPAPVVEAAQPATSVATDVASDTAA